MLLGWWLRSQDVSRSSSWCKSSSIWIWEDELALRAPSDSSNWKFFMILIMDNKSGTYFLANTQYWRLAFGLWPGPGLKLGPWRDMGRDRGELTDFLFLPHHSRGCSSARVHGCLRANLELKELNTSTPCLWATYKCEVHPHRSCHLGKFYNLIWWSRWGWIQHPSPNFSMANWFLTPTCLTQDQEKSSSSPRSKKP